MFVPFVAIPLRISMLPVATVSRTAQQLLLCPRGQCEATALLATTEHSCSQRSPEGLCHVVTEGWECGYTPRDLWLCD